MRVQLFTFLIYSHSEWNKLHKIRTLDVNRQQPQFNIFGSPRIIASICDVHISINQRVSGVWCVCVCVRDRIVIDVFDVNLIPNYNQFAHSMQTSAIIKLHGIVGRRSYTYSEVYTPHANSVPLPSTLLWI